MIPYASCVCSGRRQWKVLSAQKGTSLVIGNDSSLCKNLEGKEEKATSLFSNSEIFMLEAVKAACSFPFPFAEQEARAVGRRCRQPVITAIFDLSLLDDTYGGVTKTLLSKCNSWSFNTFNLDVSTGGRSLSYLLVHLFQEYGFVNHFQLDIVKVWHCFNLMEAAYHRHNPYHNSVHAADVTQAMHCFLQENKFSSHLTPLEAMASVIAAVAHDLDHPGVTQAFLVATSNHLVNLYHNSSVLENHHWRTAISCLRESGIFNHLDKTMWQDLQMQIRSLILATDITRQKEFLARFKNYLTSDTLNMEETEYRHFALQIALKCADLCNPCRPWAISQRWSYQVCQEFYRQGAYEKQLKLPLTPTFDCSRTKVAKIQADFFQFVVSPLFETWDHFLKTPLSRILLKNLHHNFTQWQQRITLQQPGDPDCKVIKDVPQIKVDYPSVSSVVELIAETDLEKKELLSSDIDIVLKQHRSKSDSGLAPPLLSPKIHMETYSTEELHPSTTLLSLSSITNTVQLRQVYATTKVESHLICPTVFQPLCISTSTKETEESICSSPQDCDEEYCSITTNENNNAHINSVQYSSNSSCLNGCGTPPLEKSLSFLFLKTKQRSNSLINSSDILKLPSQAIQNRRASDYGVNLHDTNKEGNSNIISVSDEKMNYVQCKDEISKPAISFDKNIQNNYFSVSSPTKESNPLTSSANCTNIQGSKISCISASESDKMIPSWGWHIRRSFSAERTKRPTYDFDSPSPTAQYSLSSQHFGRRSSAPVTYSFNAGDTGYPLSSIENTDSKVGLKSAFIETDSLERRWSIPSETPDFRSLHTASNTSENSYPAKMLNRRSSFGLLEPLLAVPTSENIVKQGISPMLKNVHSSCHMFSSHEHKDELNEHKNDIFVASDSFITSFPSHQTSVQRRGSLPTDLYHSEEKIASSNESAQIISPSGFILEHTRRNVSPGDLLSVLIGPSGMINTMHDIVSGQTICQLPCMAHESLRRKSGGLEMLSGLWRTRTNDIAIGVGMANKINLRMQLMESWTTWRKEQGKVNSSVGPNSNISSLGQQFIYQQRRGSVPLNISLSLSSGQGVKFCKI